MSGYTAVKHGVFRFFSGVNLIPTTEKNDVDGATDIEEKNVTSSTDNSWTVDDFIIINRFEMYSMIRTHSLRIMGKFENRLWFLGKNNTKYLLIPMTKEETVKELTEKLTNHTGNGQICVEGLCLDANQALHRLKSLEAELAGKLRPSDRLPFILMVSTFGVIGLFGITGKIFHQSFFSQVPRGA